MYVLYVCMYVCIYLCIYITLERGSHYRTEDTQDVCMYVCMYVCMLVYVSTVCMYVLYLGKSAGLEHRADEMHGHENSDGEHKQLPYIN